MVDGWRLEDLGIFFFEIRSEGEGKRVQRILILRDVDQKENNYLRDPKSVLTLVLI